tara:strand:- start:427 stop:768 length:342 start_codon:yes stop_codon:yes gene_type:complete
MTKEIINFSDWEKLDLRVGEVIEVDEIEGADKLYKLKINLGTELGERTVCAGIKPYYSKEELINKKIILFVNLEPRKLKGIFSEGMILAADDEKGEVILLSPEKDIEIGSFVR